MCFIMFHFFFTQINTFLINLRLHFCCNQSQKFWDNSMKHNLLGFSLKILKDSSITMLWVSNLSAAWSRCNLQTHQKVVVSIYFVTGCLNFSSFKIKFWRQNEIRRMKLYFLETNYHALSYHISKKWKIGISIMAGIPMRFNLSSGFCLMVRYLRTVKMVYIQVS